MSVKGRGKERTGIKAPRRIGIYAGTFDPVHAGHIAFALQSVEAAQLDAVYLMPERIPRHKTGVEHYGHRVHMVRRAVLPHPALRVLESVDRDFSVLRTMPRLRKRFGRAQFVLLMGSDVLRHLGEWDRVADLLRETELCIGLRGEDDERRVTELLDRLPPAVDAHIMTAQLPDVSSRTIRLALRGQRPTVRGLLRSVYNYAKREWLYL